MAAVQSGSAIFGVRLMMSWLPGISCGLAVVGMIFYPLSEKRVKEIAEELEVKRNARP
jgi:GPH family glycoside/pentoside/hexuronide:cation symporter